MPHFIGAEHGAVLAAPIMAFVQSLNRGDFAGLLSLFTSDALLNDQLRDFWGVDEIRAWLEHEALPERLTMQPLRSLVHYQDHIVEAVVSGDFDATGLPQPLVLTFHFGLHEGRIGRLLILHKRQRGSLPDLRPAGKG